MALLTHVLSLGMLLGLAAELKFSVKKFVDRMEIYSATHSKNCILIVQKKFAQGLDLISPYFHVVFQVKFPDLRYKYTVFTMGGTVALPSLPSVNKNFSGQLQFCSYARVSPWASFF